MEQLKDDLKFVTILMAANTFLQTALNAKNTFVVILLIIITVAIVVASIASMLKKNTNYLQHGYIIYVVTYIVVLLTLGLTGLINLQEVLYSIIWSITILAYVVSLSNPVISSLMIGFVLLATFGVQLTEGETVAESFNSISKLLIFDIAAIVIFSYVANKKVVNKENKKDKIKSIITFEMKPLKVGICPHIIVWSLIVSSTAYIAKTQFYNVISADMRYVILATVSVLITTFLTICALTSSILIVEMFTVYTVAEWYTMSFLIFTQNYNWGIELSTVVIDTVFLGYMINKYKRLTKKSKAVGEKEK